MNKKFIVLLITFPLVLLMCWTIFLTAQRSSGRDVVVSVMGYDPRDLISGHYISYQIDWSKTDCSQFEDGLCPRNEFCKKARWGRECRFYIPEQNAMELDRLFRLRDDDSNIFEVVYSYKKGFEPIAKQLLINRKDWRESIKK